MDRVSRIGMLHISSQLILMFDSYVYLTGVALRMPVLLDVLTIVDRVGEPQPVLPPIPLLWNWTMHSPPIMTTQDLQRPLWYAP